MPVVSRRDSSTCGFGLAGRCVALVRPCVVAAAGLLALAGAAGAAPVKVDTGSSVVRIQRSPLKISVASDSGRDRIATLEPAMQAMMICGPHSGWLATHPPLEERIEALRQYSGARLRLQPAAA